jgi:hypothetical protein
MLGKSKVQGYKTRGNLYFTLFSFFGLSYLMFCHLGYVCSIKEKLFSMTKEEQKKIKDTYKDKVLEPLTSQFLKRPPKVKQLNATGSEKRKLQNSFHQVNEKPLLITPQKLSHNKCNQ